ncbi:MAG: oligosaccharide flippase family protein [Acetobacteraceae bacterium]|nr:oligosaccharide flippase family protein [Acetobacteraceae bacterium]
MRLATAKRPGGGALWAGAEAALSASLSFSSAFVLARVIGPAEIGVGAAAVALHVLLWVAVNALFADALVQSPTVTEDDAASAFWASTALGAAAGGVQFALAWPLARALGDSRLIPMCMLLATALPLVGAGGAIQGLLTRERHYRALAGRAIFGQGLGTACGIACALAGAGAWALIIQQTMTSAFGALSLLGRAGWSPRFVCRWESAKALLRLGVPLTLSTLVQQGRYRLFAMLIGGTAGTAALGQIHMAFRLSDTVRELASTALWRLMLPILSRRQNDLVALQSALDRLLALSGFFMFPGIAALLLTVEPIVELLLGPVWAPSGRAATILIALLVYVFLSFPGGVAMVARGGARYPLIANLASTAAVVSGVLLFRPATPVAAASIWIAGQLVVAPYMLLATARVMHAIPLRQWRDGISTLLTAALAGTLAFLLSHELGQTEGPLAVIAARLLVGAVIYTSGAVLFLRPIVREVMRGVAPRALSCP